MSDYGEFGYYLVFLPQLLCKQVGSAQVVGHFALVILLSLGVGVRYQPIERLDFGDLGEKDLVLRFQQLVVK